MYCLGFIDPPLPNPIKKYDTIFLLGITMFGFADKPILLT